jgi:hypothetical protein
MSILAEQHCKLFNLFRESILWHMPPCICLVATCNVTFGRLPSFLLPTFPHPPSLLPVLFPKQTEKTPKCPDMRYYANAASLKMELYAK